MDLSLDHLIWDLTICQSIILVKGKHIRDPGSQHSRLEMRCLRSPKPRLLTTRRSTTDLTTSKMRLWQITILTQLPSELKPT